MTELRVLIPAAGRGRRAGLPYPKTLFPINGIPILHRLLAVLHPYDAMPTVVVSPAGEPLIRDSLMQINLDVQLVLQPEPRGMGDAVLRFDQSLSSGDTEHILLVWGDLANLQPSTVSSLVDAHFASGNDFTFATRIVDQAYTVVQRDDSGLVVAVSETCEQEFSSLRSGERDIGLFVFRKQPVFSLLQADLPERFGTTTGEHGFLYVIKHLVLAGCNVDALPIASELDLISLNYLTDIH